MSEKSYNHDGREQAQGHSVELLYEMNQSLPIASEGEANPTKSRRPADRAREVEEEETPIGHSEEARQHPRKNSQAGNEAAHKYCPLTVPEK